MIPLPRTADTGTTNNAVHRPQPRSTTTSKTRSSTSSLVLQAYTCRERLHREKRPPENHPVHQELRFPMAKLIYSAIASLDGYVEDEQGRFDWAAPDEEVHAFVNDLERPVGTYLYGRRLYETMVYWETDDDEAAVARD